MKKLFVCLMLVSTICAMDNYSPLTEPEEWSQTIDDNQNLPIMNIIVKSEFSFANCNDQRLKQDTEEIYGISITKNQFFTHIYFDNLGMINQTIQLPKVILYELIKNCICGQIFNVKLKSVQFDCKVQFVDVAGY